MCGSQHNSGKHRYRRVTEEEKSRMVDLYTQDKLSSLEIGRLMDRQPVVVRRCIQDRGVSTQQLKWNAKMAVEMIEKGVPMEDVSRIVGRSPKVIGQYIRRHARSK
jgi:IS30 family transposase